MIARRDVLRWSAALALLQSVTRKAMATTEMITRPIPSSGEAMPVVGLGTWQAFDVGSGDPARQNLRAVVQALIDGGGRMIDSSPMYGRAEAVAGDIVAEAGLRPRVFLATKVWTSGREQGIAQMRRSAELMRSPVLDLIQIHNLVDWSTHLATLRRLKAEGQVRYIGLTHYTTGSLPELARILDSENGIDFVQCAYSLDSPEAETRLLPVAAARGAAVIVNRPFGTGGMFRRVRGRALPDWAAELGCASWAQLFLKYLIAEPAVTCVIPGTGNPAHMADNAAAGGGPLPDAAQRRRIRQFWGTL
jgi:diketogulonate reductase-like aldo/keto reductase